MIITITREFGSGGRMRGNSADAPVYGRCGQQPDLDADESRRYRKAGRGAFL